MLVIHYVTSYQRNFHARTKLFNDSYFPSTLRLWNELSESLRNAQSLDVFKRMLLNNYPTTNVPPYYFTGHRKLQVLHTRLRTESRCLKDHLFSKNIVDSTTCQCGLVENNTHYLLQCLLASMDPLLPPNIQCSTNLLLYGHTDLSLKTNTLIFKNVYTYIKSTKRFDN